MRPKKRKTTGSNFRARLDQIITVKHELVSACWQDRLNLIDGEIAPLYSENGRGDRDPLMIGLLLIKHIYGLSDEGVRERWVHNPYSSTSPTKSSSSTPSGTSART